MNCSKLIAAHSGGDAESNAVKENDMPEENSPITEPTSPMKSPIAIIAPCAASHPIKKPPFVYTMIASIIVWMVLQVSSKEISFAYSYSRLYFSHSLRSVSLPRISFIISG